jgi:hypothetical protein
MREMCLFNSFRHDTVALPLPLLAPGQGSGSSSILRFALEGSMEEACLAAAVPDAMLDLRKIRRRREAFGEPWSEEAASEDSTETLTCAICLGSIENFVSASCMSCVCEGIFHKECLERVPTVEPHALHGDRRQCPYCRTRGTIVELHKEVYRMCPPANKRERVEKRVRQMWTLASSTRDSLEETERELRRMSRLLGERMNALRRLPGGAQRYEDLLYPPLRAGVAVPWTGKTLCRTCGEGIMGFSDLTTQACHCGALYHLRCLKNVCDRTPTEKIPCCPSCRSLGIVHEGVSVKELVSMACLSSPRGASSEEAREEASAIRAHQGKCLALLGEHVKRVEVAIRGLRKREAPPSCEPSARRKPRLAYLPP